MFKKIIVLVFLMSFVGCQQCFGVVNTTAVPERFPANGSATTFNFDMRLTSQTELAVIVRADSTGVDTDLVLNVGYTLSATNNDFSSGGTLKTDATYASGNTLILHRNALRTQEVNLIQGQSLPAEATETTFDKQTMAIQDIDKDLIFYLSVPFGDPTTALSLELPSSVDRASRTFTFDANGNPAATDGTTGVTVSPYAETYIDDTSEAAFKVTTNLETGIDLQAWDTQLDDIAALAVTNSNFIVGDGTNWVAETGATVRTSLGLAIGSDVHAYTTNGNTILTDAGVLSIAGLTTAADKMIYTDGSDSYAVTDLTAYARTLNAAADAAEARTTLGVTALTDAIKKDGSTAYTGTGVGFKDEDNMASDSATATASQQSIKAYIDNSVSTDEVAGAAFGGSSESTTFSNGMIIKAGQTATFSANEVKTITFGDAFGTACISVVITPFDDTNDEEAFVPHVKTIAAANFSMRHTGTTSGFAYSWIAIGY